MLPWSATVAKLNSEVATLKFLSTRTSVRVPRLIGFSLGEDEISAPFMITQHVRGLPLNIYWKRYGKIRKFEEEILQSLAQQYLSLLSHPFDRIGSLCLTQDSNGWEIGTAPLSIDEFDLYRDGLELTLTTPLCSSDAYYESQTNLFGRYIKEHRNSVFHEEDALQKYVTPEVFRRVVPYYMDKKFNKGPFFLCHLDLHASNVITNKNLEVEAILDWEFASILPVEIACAPPRCLVIDDPDNLQRGSDAYSLYASRLQIFMTHVQSSPSVLSSPPLSEDNYILRRLRDSLTKNQAFFAWSASDIRNMYSILWDHIALTTPLLLNRGGCEGLQNQEGVVFESEQELVHAIIERSDSNELKEWVAERLAALASYRAEKELSTCPESNIDLSYS
jgi:hypothetical protein